MLSSTTVALQSFTAFSSLPTTAALNFAKEPLAISFIFLQAFMTYIFLVEWGVSARLSYFVLCEPVSRQCLPVYIHTTGNKRGRRSIYSLLKIWHLPQWPFVHSHCPCCNSVHQYAYTKPTTQAVHYYVAVTRVVQWDANVCETALRTRTMVVHAQRWVGTDEEQENMVSMKVSWGAEAAKRFLFRISFNRRWFGMWATVSSLT